MTSGVTCGRACYAAPGGFTATSAVHSKKKTTFLQRKTKKSSLGTSDKQVAAGKNQPSALCLPFPQHLKAFLVLDMSHWKSPLSSDALPPGLFFRTPFDATFERPTTESVLSLSGTTLPYSLGNNKKKGKEGAYFRQQARPLLMGRFAKSPSSREHHSHLRGWDINSPSCVCS